MDFKSELKAYAEYCNSELDRLIPKEDNYQSIIYDAMRYSLLAGGKRIRPVLLYATAEFFGVSKEDVSELAAAIEMIHTYSLIHDDLPSMDNDDYRRGRLTNHKVYGEANAILAGDALLTKAFETAAKSKLCTSEIIRLYGEAAGPDGMVGGQVIDLLAEKTKIDFDELNTLCNLKTGALLTLPIKIALSISGHLNDEIGAKFIQYAYDIGLAFQIKDDILDVEGDLAVLGKRTGMDAEDNKTTFVSLIGIDAAKARLSELTSDAMLVCDSLANMNGFNTDKAKFLRMLAIYLLERNN